MTGHCDECGTNYDIPDLMGEPFCLKEASRYVGRPAVWCNVMFPGRFIHQCRDGVAVRPEAMT